MNILSSLHTLTHFGVSFGVSPTAGVYYIFSISLPTHTGLHAVTFTRGFLTEAGHQVHHTLDIHRTTPGSLQNINTLFYDVSNLQRRERF